MTRFLSGLSLFLFCCSAYAQTGVPNDPEPASPTVVIIFVVLFVVCCVGFVWMIYSAERKKKQGNTKTPDASGKTT